MGERDRDRERELKMLLCWLWRWKKVLQTKKCRQLLEAEKGKERDSFLELPEGILSC